MTLFSSLLIAEEEVEVEEEETGTTSSIDVVMNASES
jgi:hypothetical protein